MNNNVSLKLHYLCYTLIFISYRWNTILRNNNNILYCHKTDTIISHNSLKLTMQMCVYVSVCVRSRACGHECMLT